MVDPIRQAIAWAPIDDEVVSEEDRSAVVEADEWRKSNQPIPLDDVLADFGLTLSDWERMGKLPLPAKHG